MNIVKRIPRPMPLMEKVADMNYPVLFSLWVMVNVVCAILYYLLATYHPEHGPIQLVAMTDHYERMWNSIYFSVMTATTTGYGDIVPQGLSKLIASLESITAFFVFSIFLAKMAASHAVKAAEEEKRA